jgi:gamma-glutamyltranspeptidase/glutathione hydrolase
MLDRGGNAADAAAAIGFSLSVVESSMSGLGGRAQILMRDPSGSVAGIDAQTVIPALYSAPLLLPQWSGVEVVGVPGTVAGLLKLHAEHGSLPLQEVMAPAIGYAENGYEILAGGVSRHKRVEEKIRSDTTLSAIYLNEASELLAPGDLFVQKDLAATLKAIAQGGHDAFYKGDIARKMAADIEAKGGSLRYDEIAAYQAKDATVIRTDYRGYEVIGLTGPANGTAVLAALNILEGLDLASMSELEWAQAISETMAMVMQRTVMDDSEDVGYKDTLSEATTLDYRSRLTASSPAQLDQSASVRHINSDEQRLAMTSAQVDWSGADNGANSHHTTHYVASDAKGMMVTITQTLGPNMGSKVMTEGLGFLYAQTGGMPGWAVDHTSGTRPRTSIAPTILLKDGEPFMALGAAGGTLIPPAIVQVISRVLDQGMNLEDALAAPRVSPSMSLLPPSFNMEEIVLEQTPLNGWSDKQAEGFKALGLEVKSKTKYGLLGRVNALKYDAASRTWIGGADPDWEGSAEASLSLPVAKP